MKRSSTKKVLQPLGDARFSSFLAIGELLGIKKYRLQNALKLQFLLHVYAVKALLGMTPQEMIAANEQGELTSLVRARPSSLPPIMPTTPAKAVPSRQPIKKPIHTMSTS